MTANARLARAALLHEGSRVVFIETSTRVSRVPDSHVLHERYLLLFTVIPIHVKHIGGVALVFHKAE